MPRASHEVTALIALSVMQSWHEACCRSCERAIELTRHGNVRRCRSVVAYGSRRSATMGRMPVEHRHDGREGSKLTIRSLNVDRRGSCERGRRRPEITVDVMHRSNVRAGDCYVVLRGKHTTSDRRRERVTGYGPRVTSMRPTSGSAPGSGAATASLLHLRQRPPYHSHPPDQFPPRRQRLASKLPAPVSTIGLAPRCPAPLSPSVHPADLLACHGRSPAAASRAFAHGRTSRGRVHQLD